MATEKATMTGTVLIVDPQEAAAAVLSTPLSGLGLEVVVAGDASEAVTLLAGCEPDIILCDLELPDMSGIEFCRKMKSNAAHLGIPILMMAATPTRRAEMDALQAGAVEVLKRPIEMEPLHRILRRWIPQGSRSIGSTISGTMKGSLADVEFTNVIQCLAMSTRDLDIELRSGEQSGQIVLRGGNVIHAQVADLTGMDALTKLLAWNKGTFAACPGGKTPEKTIDGRLMSVLMECARLADEQSS